MKSFDKKELNCFVNFNYHLLIFSFVFKLVCAFDWRGNMKIGINPSKSAVTYIKIGFLHIYINIEVFEFTIFKRAFCQEAEITTAQIWNLKLLHNRARLSGSSSKQGVVFATWLYCKCIPLYIFDLRLSTSSCQGNGYSRIRGSSCGLILFNTTSCILKSNSGVSASVLSSFVLATRR